MLGPKLARVQVSLFFVLMISVSTRAQTELDKLTSDYRSVAAQLQQHVVDDSWIDDTAESPGLLEREWSLAGEWVAAWLNTHPAAGAEEIKAAIRGLAREEGGEPECLMLADGAFVVTAPGPIGNVFIVAKAGGSYQLVWSTAQKQEAQGRFASSLAAWRAENARERARAGPYGSSRAGSLVPSLGALPSDGRGNPRFYIHALYAQQAGGTVAAQISLWAWDGKTARLQIGREYAFMIDQQVGTRVEGDLLKVQEKKSFRSFFSCGSCEERQTDWTIRLTPNGIEDLGEKSLVPELDAVDELFYRVIHHQQVTGLAAPAVTRWANEIVQGARQEHSRKEWKDFPTLGMLGGWSVQKTRNGRILCMEVDDAGRNLFTLKPVHGRLFIADVKETKQDCEKH
jgi:hypothetical protein